MKSIIGKTVFVLMLSVAGVFPVAASADLGYVGSDFGSGGDLGFVGSDSNLGFVGSGSNLGFVGSDSNLGYVGSGDLGFVGSDSNLGYVGSDSNLGYVGSGDLGYVGRDTNLGYVGADSNLGYVGRDTNLGYVGRDTNLGYVGRDVPAEQPRERFETVTYPRERFETVTYPTERFETVTYPTERFETVTYDVFSPSYRTQVLASMPFYAASPAQPFYSQPFVYPQLTYHQAYQPPVVVPPGNTIITERTDTCIAPHSCSTTYTDNSVFNAPTTINSPTNITVTNPPTVINNNNAGGGGSAPVYPIYQSPPHYNVQAYVPPVTYPSYPTYNPTYNPYVAPVYPAQSQPYVALTQIPYTGLELGLFGNLMYWGALAAVAAAAGYLLVYYMPLHGAPSFAGMFSRANSVPFKSNNEDEVENEIEKKNEPVAVKPAPAFAQAYSGTRDSMNIIRSENGMAPRIVISRSF